MSTGRVIHVSDMTSILDAAYVGRSMPRQSLRGSPLANPFKVGRDGDRAVVIRDYTRWLTAQIEQGDRAVINALIACRDRPLACWCRKDGEAWSREKACHADVILAALNWWDDEQLRAFIG